MAQQPNAKGHIVVFLHAHLPYVRHLSDPGCLEEDWFYEAVIETYLPLLAVAEGWVRDAISARITVSLSPTLMAMMSDELLLSRCSERIDRLVDLAEHELARTSGDERFEFTAQMYHRRLVDTQARLSADMT